MTKPVEKLIVAPVDGSANALKAMEYLGFYADGARMAIHLLYVMPPLPPILVEESRTNRQTEALLKKMQEKSKLLADDALVQARQRLIAVGFPEGGIKSTVLAQNYPVAASICAWSEKKSADAIVMSSRGRGRLESFFMGATTQKVVDASELCPVWVINGNVTDRGILIGVDHSPEALRAVDHAGLMLACGNQPITLFYSRRCLTCFVPRQVADAAPGMEQIWQDRAGRRIAPIMEKARQVLVDAGVDPSRIGVRVAEGSRSAAADLLKTARSSRCGTIIVGRRGSTSSSVFRMGSVSRGVLESSEHLAVWIVP